MCNFGLQKLHKKKVKGTPQWKGEHQMVEDTKKGGMRKKLVYEDKDKKDFMSLVFGQWNYFADTKTKNKGNIFFGYTLSEQLKYFHIKKI